MLLLISNRKSHLKLSRYLQQSLIPSKSFHYPDNSHLLPKIAQSSYKLFYIPLLCKNTHTGKCQVLKIFSNILASFHLSSFYHDLNCDCLLLGLLVNAQLIFCLENTVNWSHQSPLPYALQYTSICHQSLSAYKVVKVFGERE